MKGISLILLILIYSMSIFGVSVSEFYCCGKLKSVSVSLADIQKDKAGKENCKKNCCETKSQYFKVKDSHLPTTHIATHINFPVGLHITSSLQPVVMIAAETDIINGSHAPPLYRDVPVYLSNCVFRI